MLWSIREVFPALQHTPDDVIQIAVKLPGLNGAVQIIPSLWQHIWSIVTDVVVSIPPIDDGEGFTMTFIRLVILS